MSSDYMSIYLLPTVLSEEAQHTVPSYVIEAVKECQVIFAENLRTARRYLKSVWKEMVIDEREWFELDKEEAGWLNTFEQKIKEGKNIGIISEAGCPGVADPGQLLVARAQQLNVVVHPLVGPNSILLALMASGMNGQQFEFRGYLPISNDQKIQQIRQMENDAARKQSTQIFIETPYRNNQLIETLLKTCRPATRLCLAADITGKKEFIKTKSIAEWKKEVPDLHKIPAIFLLSAQG